MKVCGVSAMWWTQAIAFWPHQTRKQPVRTKKWRCCNCRTPTFPYSQVRKSKLQVKPPSPQTSVLSHPHVVLCICFSLTRLSIPPSVPSPSHCALWTVPHLVTPALSGTPLTSGLSAGGGFIYQSPQTSGWRGGCDNTYPNPPTIGAGKYEWFCFLKRHFLAPSPKPGCRCRTPGGGGKSSHLEGNQGLLRRERVRQLWKCLKPYPLTRTKQWVAGAFLRCYPRTPCLWCSDNLVWLCGTARLARLNATLQLRNRTHSFVHSLYK